MNPWLVFLIVFLVSSLLAVIIYFSVTVTRFYKFVKNMEMNSKDIDNFGNVNLQNDKDGVDVVYTWVNTRDKKWQSLKNKYSNKNKDYDNSKARWTNTSRPYDEIFLSIKSIRKYLPWIKNIYVIAHRPQSLPQWILNEYNVKMVYHDEIFPKESKIPTFNSIAIETNLHRVPNLSEKFIYFNDDMYINKHLKESDFFRYNKPIFRYDKGYSLSLVKDANLRLPTVKMYTHTKQVYNTIRLLNKKYLNPIHQATPLTKTIMENTEKKFPDAWNKARNMRFRESNTIIPVYLAINHASHTKDVKDLLIDNVKTQYIDKGINGISNNSHLVCINYIEPDEIDVLTTIILGG